MRWTTALFDLDGTLTDPEKGICRSVMYALEKAGMPVGALESYHRYIGPPLLHSFQTYEGVTPEEAQTLLGYYRERFSVVGLYENEVYPGIPELLRDLHERVFRPGPCIPVFHRRDRLRPHPDGALF